MKNYWKIMLMAVVVMTMGSCSKEDPQREPNPKPIPGKLASVELSLVTEDDMPSVRAMDENAIRNVNVYLYGSKNYHFYYPSAPAKLVFEVLPGNYKLYVVANIHNDMGELTKADLESSMVSYSTMAEDIPMAAKVDVKIESNSGTLTLPNIEVKRRAAKIFYTIKCESPGIQLQSVQFCNIPKSTSLFGSVRQSTTASDFYDSDWINIDADGDSSEAFYMFENCQGTVPSITDQKDKAPGKAPLCASYMKIRCFNPSGMGGNPDHYINYIVYLGENNTSDFNVRQNTKHSMNLVITGQNEIDNRVKVYDGLFYGQANCIICDGSQVNCDITPYRTSSAHSNEYTTDYAGKDYEATSAKVIWQDKAGLISSLQVNDNSLTVNSNGQKGNAVVAICDKAGIILWSFHIWCVGGDRPQDILCENYKKARFYVMDRNLGAVTNSSVNYKDAVGLVYQWGRKDPLPSTIADYVYTPTKSGAFREVFPVKEFGWFAANDFYLRQFIVQTVQNPATSVRIQNGMMWQNDSWEQKSRDLWGDPQGYKDDYNKSDYTWSANKSVYDPCPSGYRVSNKYTWTGFSLNGATDIGGTGAPLTGSSINIIGSWIWGWQLRSTSSSSQGIYYPVTATNMSGYYWSSTGDSGGNMFFLRSNSIRNSIIADPENECAVRCVRE